MKIPAMSHLNATQNWPKVITSKSLAEDSEENISSCYLSTITPLALICYEDLIGLTSIRRAICFFIFFVAAEHACPSHLLHKQGRWGT